MENNWRGVVNGKSSLIARTTKWAQILFIWNHTQLLFCLQNIYLSLTVIFVHYFAKQFFLHHKKRFLTSVMYKCFSSISEAVFFGGGGGGGGGGERGVALEGMGGRRWSERRSLKRFQVLILRWKLTVWDHQICSSSPESATTSPGFVVLVQWS